MKRPNPLPPEQMTSAERRMELCGLLALGLIRLRTQDAAQLSAEKGEIRLHFPADLSVHATPTHEETA